MLKHSIRYKMTAILITIIGSVLFLTWILNTTFAERYYIASEKTSIISSYEKVKTLLDNSDSSIELAESLEQITISNNVKMMVVYSEDAASMNQEVIFSNMAGGTSVYEQILSYLYYVRSQISQDADLSGESGNSPWADNNMPEEMKTLVKKGYFVTQMKDKHGGQNGIYLFGFTDDDYLVAMRVSIEGIRTSIKISSHFMAYISLIAVLIGICAISIYAYSFTKPIKQMADVANRMTELDFDAVVTYKADDEIGELGQSINKLSETLESTIGDLKTANLELQQDIRKKEEIDNMRKEFLSHVSHELKTPIAIIQGYAEGLKDGVTDDKESMDYYCDVILDESKKMNQMVRKLLTLNQLEFGTTPLAITRFDLAQMIQNKISASQILFAGKEIKVIFEEEGPLYVWADEFMVEEVFVNYMTNAINHVTPQGVIRVWFEKRDGVIRTNVYNQGKPIPEEELDKLWIKFYKVDKARTREYGGNGIGLSIVAAAMKAHGKDFGVKNVEDGVVFYFDLDGESSEK